MAHEELGIAEGQRSERKGGGERVGEAIGVCLCAGCTRTRIRRQRGKRPQPIAQKAAQRDEDEDGGQDGAEEPGKEDEQGFWDRLGELAQGSVDRDSGKGEEGGLRGVVVPLGKARVAADRRTGAPLGNAAAVLGTAHGYAREIADPAMGAQRCADLGGAALDERLSLAQAAQLVGTPHFGQVGEQADHRQRGQEDRPGRGERAAAWRRGKIEAGGHAMDIAEDGGAGKGGGRG